MRLLAWILSWIIGGVFRLMDWMDSAIQLPPMQIHLQPVHGDQFKVPAELNDVIASLQAQGFEIAGHYEIAELKKLRITGLVHPASSVLAAVWQQQRQTFLDLITMYQDGTSLTFANHAEGQTLPRPPDHEAKRSPGAAPVELYQRHLAERPTSVKRNASVETFASFYEGLWRNKQEWLASRGGYNLEELRALLKTEGKTLKDAELGYFRERMASSALRNWYAMQLAPPIPFEEIDDCLVVVHDELDRHTVEYLFDRWSSGLDVPSGPLTPRQVFATLQGRPDACIERIWTKISPLEADYYAPKGYLEEFAENSGEAPDLSASARLYPPAA